MTSRSEQLLQQARDKLRRMNIPIVERPEGVESLINAPPENVAALENLDAANAMQYKISQLILFVNQEYNITKSSYNEAVEGYNKRLHQVVSQITPKSLTLKEKTALALDRDKELSSMSDCVVELKQRLELLEGWCEHLKNLYDVLKQVYYKLKAQQLPYS